MLPFHDVLSALLFCFSQVLLEEVLGTLPHSTLALLGLTFNLASDSCNVGKLQQRGEQIVREAFRGFARKQCGQVIDRNDGQRIRIASPETRA